MNVIDTTIPEIKIIEPDVFGDERGYFLESFNRARFFEHTGLDLDFVQDNHSKSGRGVLRGLHYQIEHAQGKLVRVVCGSVFDVVVDIRRSSPSFGQWVAAELSASNKLQMWVPEGFAHGFLVLEDDTEFLYKTTDYYAPEHERTISWDDPDIAIDWPLENIDLRLSEKDKMGTAFTQAECFA